MSLGNISLGRPGASISVASNLSYTVARPYSWVRTTSLSLRGPRTGWGSAPAAAHPLPRPACAHSAVFAPDTRRCSAVSGRSLGVRVRGRCGAGHFSAARLAAAPAAARPRAHAGHQVRGGWRWVSALSRAAGAEGLIGGYRVRLGGAGQTDVRGPAPPRPHYSSAACVQGLMGWGQVEAVHLLPARAHLMLPGLCPVLSVGGAGASPVLIPGWLHPRASHPRCWSSDAPVRCGVPYPGL